MWRPRAALQMPGARREHGDLLTARARSSLTRPSAPRSMRNVWPARIVSKSSTPDSARITSSASAADRPLFLSSLPSVSDLPTLPSIAPGGPTGAGAGGRHRRWRRRCAASGAEGSVIDGAACGLRLLLDRADAGLLVPDEHVEVHEDQRAEDEQHPAPLRLAARSRRPALGRQSFSCARDVRLRTMGLERPSNITPLAVGPTIHIRSARIWQPPQAICRRASSWNFSPSRGKVRRADPSKTWPRSPRKAEKPEKPQQEGREKRRRWRWRRRRRWRGWPRAVAAVGRPGMLDASLEAEARRRYLNYALQRHHVARAARRARRPEAGAAPHPVRDAARQPPAPRREASQERDGRR